MKTVLVLRVLLTLSICLMAFWLIALRPADACGGGGCSATYSGLEGVPFTYGGCGPANIYSCNIVACDSQSLCQNVTINGQPAHYTSTCGAGGTSLACGQSPYCGACSLNGPYAGSCP